MKKVVLKIVLGIVTSSLLMGILLYFFMFLNPLRIYEVNTLKWVPVLITIIGLYFSGTINKETPKVLLPVLLLPLVIFKVFNYAYFPFILILVLTGTLVLLITQKQHPLKNWKWGWMGVIGILLFFLFSQPLILEKRDFGYGKDGELINAHVVWNFNAKKTLKLPNHILLDTKNKAFDIAKTTGETQLVTFWATWCAPCIEVKPQLEAYKREFADKFIFIDVSFDDDRSKWFEYLEQTKPLGTQLISENQQKTSRAFNFNGLPMYLVVNSDGTYKKYHSFETAKTVMTRNL